MTSEKIREIISQMTLEEKVGMLSGADFWRTKGVEAPWHPADDGYRDGSRTGSASRMRAATILGSTNPSGQSVSRRDARRRQVLTGSCCVSRESISAGNARDGKCQRRTGTRDEYQAFSALRAQL